MSDIISMSKSQVEGLARTFAQQNLATIEVERAIQGALDGTTWTGGRSDQFRTLWESEFKPNLRALQAALTENSGFITRELQNASMALDG